VLLGLLLCAPFVERELCFGQTTKPAADSIYPPKDQPPTDFRVPLLKEPLRLADFPKMQPNPDLKDTLAHVTGFIQNTPTDGQPATEQTEVWIGRTKSDLYFVFICHDDRPNEIRGHLTRLV